MVFNSIFFIFCFLPVFMLIYYLVPGKLRNLLLFLGSLIFYAWGEPVYVILMLFSYYMGTELERLYYDDKKQKLNLVFAIIINLGILVFFKYYGFLLDTFGGITGIHISHPELSLPIGLSFYTFRNLSYLFDIYISKITAQQNFLTFATYSTMFPYTAAGPIIRYADIQEQLERRSVNISRFGAGTELFIKGLAKKVLLADNLSALYAGICSNTQMSVLTAWIGILTFTMQIYFDFSGYSDMAIGLGKMLGFDFNKNFDYPYISTSVSEFWRRWHISLSSWLRDYLYISLGGNRHGKFRQYLNLIITMFLGGLWHGASWNFVLWGTFHGVALALHKAWMSIIGRKKGETSHGIRRVLGVIITFHFVCFCWIFFRNADFHNSMDMLNQIFTAFRPQLFPQLIEGYWRVFALMAVGFLLHFAPDSWENAVCRGVIKLPFLGKAIVMVAMIYLVIQMKSSEIQPFIYFQF